MMGLLRRQYDSFRGSGDHSITVPPMDGAMRPNNAIEEGELLLNAAGVDNVVAADGRVAYSSGDQVFLLAKGGKADLVAGFGSPVSALAVSKDSIAVGLCDGRVLVHGGAHDGRSFVESTSFPVNCPTALAFRGADTLLVANGSSANAPTHWKHDLMQLNAKGSVWELDLATGAPVRLADGMAYPNGLLPLSDGRVLVSESWRYRLVKVGRGQALEVALADLPAYPGRLAPAAGDEGAWLALFAPRRRLVELVLREKGYRRRMMAEIDPDYWISPSLRPMSSFLEPLQGGTLKKLARLKPWAPSRSYGLIVRLDAEFQPVASFHSRADGTRHGISSCAISDGLLIAACTGGDALVSIDPKGL